MVFYRPEVHNELESDKLRVGLKAVLFTQSNYRRNAARSYFLILWQARAYLRECIRSGMYRNSSFVEAIPDIEASIAHCRDVGMYSYELGDGARLLDRLYIVNAHLSKVKQLIDKYGVNDDITIEYEAMRKILAESEELQVESELVDDLLAKHNDLKERFESIMDLRSAVNALDEGALDDCLTRIVTLTETWGKYCSIEVLAATTLRKKLTQELTAISSIRQVIRNSQDELIVWSEEPGNESGLAAIPLPTSPSDVITKSCEDLLDILSPWLGDTPEPFSSTIPSKIITAGTLMVSLRSHWNSGNWSQVGAAMADLQGIGKFLQDICTKNASGKLSKIIENSKFISKLIEVESTLVSVGIDMHVIMPVLRTGLIAAVNISNDVSLTPDSLNIDSLQNAVEQVSRLDVMGTAARNMLNIATRMLVLFTAVQSGDIFQVFALSESSNVFLERLERCKSLVRQLQAAGTNAECALCGLIDKELPSDVQYNAVVEEFSDSSTCLSKDYGDILELMKKSIVGARVHCLSEYTKVTFILDIVAMVYILLFERCTL